jgi:predicted  nucleic acid-binding Zn-ribbon protein
MMEKIERLTQEIAQLSTETADKEAVYKKAEEELKAEETAIRQEREKDVAESSTLARDIDKEVIRLYQFIRSRYPDTLVAAKSGVCTGCNMNIPPQLFLELRKLLKLCQCPSCKRILYVMDEAEVAPKTAENKIAS